MIKKIAHPVKKLFIYFATLTGILLFTYFGVLIHAYYNPQIDFKTYIPTKTPQNLRITAKKIEVWSAYGLDLWPYQKNIHIALGRGEAYILESPYIKDYPDDCDLPVVNQTCVMNHTVKQQRYIIKRTYYNSDLISTSATFKASETLIVINAKASINLNDEEWGEIVDSFVPAVLTDLKVRHRQPG